MKRPLLTASLFLAAACAAQTAPRPTVSAVHQAARIVFLGSVKTGNPALDDEVRVAARNVIERYGRKIADGAGTADVAFEIEVRQLAEPDPQSSGKFVEVRVLDTKTHARLFLTDQAADRGTGPDIVHTAEKAVSEFFNPSIPPPPV